MRVSKLCPECHGECGFFITPNGDSYVNEEPDSVWHPCESCEGCGVIYDEEQE